MPKKTLKIRPYARLLTMLGEQLIKNEQIALAELIKNAYDADADWVKVSFVGFLEKGDKLEISNSSKIIIEDNGSGMTLDTIEKSWMNPATPNKKAEIGKEKRTPLKSRVIQGEKGIGRFAILKLGRKIAIITRVKDNKEEFVIDYDLSAYDDDFLTIDGEERELYIDDISINVYSQPATQIVDRIVTINSHKNTENNKGTRIEISNLKGEWNRRKIEEVSRESQKLQSIFDKIFEKRAVDKFEIGFEVNNERVSASDKTIEELSNLLQYNSVLKITKGKYKEKEKCFEFCLNNNPFKLLLEDAVIAGISIFKEYFVSKDLFDNSIIKNSTCGDFNFNFFIFDLYANKDSIFYLDTKEKELIKEHRIYLYRDKIRVAPYGDPDDDWVGTDKKRALARSGDYLSNDQVVGFVDITKKDNPKLKDKTNREGLIEDGSATKDFVVLLQTFLRYIRLHPYDQYKKQIEQIEQQKINKLRIVDAKFEGLKNCIGNNAVALQAYNDVVKSYKIEQDFYKKQLETTTDLAGVGLSVETASHDIMMMLRKGMEAIDSLIKDIEGNVISEQGISEELLKIRGVFSFVDTQMRDIQLLFKSSKQRRRSIRVIDILDKVIVIYKRTLQRKQIELNINKIGSPIIAKCTDAILLQLLINLFDNAVYWLSVVNIPVKKICITLDGERQQVIFSDNGPGIREDDQPYIFEAFYSGKEDGRGLGLYIAKQLLTRMGYSIELADIPAEKVLEGANFVVNFIKLDEE